MVGVELEYGFRFFKDFDFFLGGVSDNPIFLHISSSLVNARLHTEN